MSDPITKVQHEILDLMTPGHYYTSRNLGCRISSLRSLENKGCVESKGSSRPGAFSMPESTIQWTKVVS